MPLRRLLILVAVCCALGLVTPASAASSADDRQILQILNRLTLGPTAADVAHVKAIGIDRYIAEQLDPEAIPEPALLKQQLAKLDTLQLNPVQLFDQHGPLPKVGGVKPTPEEQKARRQAARIIVQQEAAARIFRALYSRRQLQEVMVNFWFNHFNVFAGKGLDRLWIGAYEEQAIRPYALGRFGDLLLATAQHPAMLFYLDNWENSAAGTTLPNGRKLGLNENYAREVMELHTLGVNGGYSQADVIALARILTGWGLARGPDQQLDGTGFYFNPARHDFGPKEFLGSLMEPAGEGEGISALDILARSPATAHHIAFELAQYFVSDNPPADLVDRLAARFSDTSGDIREVLATLFASPEFRNSAGDKYKTPYRFVLSAARAAGLSVENPQPLLGMMARLGMPLYGCQTPDGYKNTESAWLSPEAATLRVSFAAALAGGNLPLAAAPADHPAIVPVASTRGPTAGEPVDATALEHLLAPILSPHTRAVVAAAPPRMRAALLLGSPDFMHY